VVIDPADATLTVDFEVHANGAVVYKATEKDLGSCPSVSSVTTRSGHMSERKQKCGAVERGTATFRTNSHRLVVVGMILIRKTARR